jgi:RNA polymerase sigma-70 factor (ECF subfamily)
VTAHDASQLERIFREEFGRVVATLVRLFGDIDLAEEMAQDAFVIATEKWATDGLPPNPGGWLTTTARNRAIDRLRRESTRDARHAQAEHERDDEPNI